MISSTDVGRSIPVCLRRITAGWGWTAAVHPEDRQPFLDMWRASLAYGEPLEWKARFRSAANGEYRWVLARSVPLRDEQRKHSQVVWNSDGHRRPQARRRRAREAAPVEAELAHINRVSMMGELSASIAHEVNQPLSGIVSNGSACLRWLAGDTPNLEEAREAVRDIVRDGKRAGEVIARIRALTKGLRLLESRWT